MTDVPRSVDPRLITEAAQLAELGHRLAAKRRVALDTEAASFHRYVDRVCLVQVSADEEHALVDPLTLDDLGPIGALLANANIEKIFHDADYDLRILDRDYGFHARRLWDTKVAAQLLGETAFGLGSLLEKYFGITLSKKLQRADWSRRPLTDAMVTYAAADTAYLSALRDALADRLAAAGREAWAHEEFERLEQVRWTGPGEQGQAFLRLKGAKALRGMQLAVLEELFGWRERTAEALDRAPFRVLSNDALMALARGAPETREALTGTPGMPASLVRRYGADLIDAVRRGRARPEDEWPRVERTRRERPDAEAELRYQRLRGLRAQRAEAAALDPGLLCPNAMLRAIARLAPTAVSDLDTIPELRRWQREAMGEAAILRRVGGA